MKLQRLSIDFAPAAPAAGPRLASLDLAMRPAAVLAITAFALLVWMLRE